MSLRKERVHETGFANVDFRTKRDLKALELYQPWKVFRHYGTINDYGFKYSLTDKKKIFETSKELNTQRSLNSELPDPKTYQSAQFYKDNKINLNIRTMYTNERFAQLDESLKGKDRFLGDSMMIADINKMRQEKKKKKRFIDQQQIKKQEFEKKIITEKDLKNKEAIQETQLVKINATETLEGKVDINKLKEIRLALRRRYANRKNFSKIFSMWSSSRNNEITVYDAHKMINGLSIPINYNESRALIASANKRGTDSLDLEEFIDLIFSDNDALNVDLKNIQFKDEKQYTEGQEVENLKIKLRSQLLEKNKGESLKFLVQYFKAKKPIFINKVKELRKERSNKDKCEDPYCDFETFLTVLKTFNLPEKYLEKGVLDDIYEKYKDKETEKMNYHKFLDYCMKLKEENNFFDFDSKYLDLVRDKLNRCKTEVEERKNALGIKKNLLEELKDTYEKEIIEYKEKREKEKLKYMPNGSQSHYQPSKEFINMIFANREKYFEELNNVEKSFDPAMTMVGVDQRKTRHGANPNENTYPMVKPAENTPAYLDEKGRFEKVLITENERAFSQGRRNAIINRIKKAENNYRYNTSINDHAEDAYQAISSYFRADRKLKYEKINKDRNEIIE